MSALLKVTEEIVDERKGIWREAPLELETFKSLGMGHGGKTTSQIYSLYDGYRNQRNLAQFRVLLSQDDLSVDETRKVLAPFVKEMAERFQIWKFERPKDLFFQAAELLSSAESKDELLSFIDEALLYNNRLWSWMDAEIPWTELDKKIYG